ncbi:MAG: SDR family oxidoreductase, partial [Nitrospinota bacterium]
ILTDRVMQTRRARAERGGVPVEKLLQEVAEGIPLNRIGDPAEFGGLVAFLASPESSYITGTVLLADGGRVRGY